MIVQSRPALLKSSSGGKKNVAENRGALSAEIIAPAFPHDLNANRGFVEATGAKAQQVVTFIEIDVAASEIRFFRTSIFP